MLTSVIVTERLYVVHLIFKHIKRLQDIYIHLKLEKHLRKAISLMVLYHTTGQ